jgi:arylformamidase
MRGQGMASGAAVREMPMIRRTYEKARRLPPMNPPVYRHYDQASLDAQYNNRTKVPDFQERHIARWMAAGEQARSRFAGRLQQRYDTTSGQTLNVFLPAGSGPWPVMMYIHGGYWMALDKSATDCVALGFVPHGVAVVNIDYSLMPSARMDELVRQARAALSWVHAHAPALDLDPQRLWVAGHSCGGHLMAAVAAQGWAGRPALAGGFSFSGLHDLEPIQRTYLNQTLKMDADEAARNSPVLMTAPPDGDWTLYVGEREGEEYLRQSVALAQAWPSTTARRMALEVMAEQDHFSLVAPLEDPTSVLVARMCDAMLRRAACPGS